MSERHNHVTRDIKPVGACPACNRYHERSAVRADQAARLNSPDEDLVIDLMIVMGCRAVRDGARTVCVTHARDMDHATCPFVRAHALEIVPVVAAREKAAAERALKAAIGWIDMERVVQKHARGDDVTGLASAIDIVNGVLNDVDALAELAPTEGGR